MHLSIRLITVVLLLLVVASLVRDAMRGERRALPISALMILATVLGSLELRAQDAERRLGAVASQLALRDVDVRCEGFFGDLVDVGIELGTVQFDADGNPADHTDLTRSACDSLKDYLGGDREPRLDAAYGVHTLAHEAIHLKGVINEAVTECISLQQTTRAARLLGADKEEARALTELYVRDVYPRLPSNYRHPECRAGGELDNDPENPEWP